MPRSPIYNVEHSNSFPALKSKMILLIEFGAFRRRHMPRNTSVNLVLQLTTRKSLAHEGSYFRQSKDGWCASEIRKQSTTKDTFDHYNKDTFDHCTCAPERAMDALK